MAALVCWSCGASLADVPRPISRHANCPGCFEVLHCCRMCKWYAPGRPQDCDHDRADPPVEKESANFCDYFRPRPNAWQADEGREKTVAKSRAAALFGEEEANENGEASRSNEKPSEDKDSTLRSKLDDLFKD